MVGLARPRQAGMPAPASARMPAPATIPVAYDDTTISPTTLPRSNGGPMTRPGAELTYRHARAHPAHTNPGPAVWYVVAALASFGANFLMVAIFFYTADRFRWGLVQNFLLAAAQGVVYIPAALLADRVVARLGRRGMLLWLYVAASAVTA